MKDGCEWRGKLGEFEQHLNRNPSLENQLDGCQFVGVECKYICGGWYWRCDVSVHQIEHCMKRPYSCGYCQVHESTFEHVTQNHYFECPKYPVVCPNVCRQNSFERQDIEGHLKDDCPLAKVSCPLHYAGCEVELPHKDMPEHMKDTVTHLTLLANVTLSLVKENQELKEVVGKKNQQIDEMAQEVHELRQRMTASEAETRKSFAGLRLKEVVGKKNQQIDEMAQEVHELRQRMTASEAETRKSFAGLRQKEVVGKKNQQIDEMAQEVHELRQRMTASEAETRKSFAGLRQKEVVGKKNQQIDEMAQEVHELRQRMTASEAETRKSFAGLRLKEVVGKKNQQIDEMAQEVHELRQRMTASEAETRKSFAGLRLSVHDKFQAHDKVDREVQKCVQELTFHKLGLPVSFRVRQDVEEVALPPFYTHSHGYKFCVDVLPQGDGDGMCQSTHTS